MAASPTTSQLYRQFTQSYKRFVVHTDRLNTTKNLPSPYKWLDHIKHQLRSKQLSADTLVDYTVLLHCTLEHNQSLKSAGWGLQQNSNDQIAATARYVGLNMPKLHKHKE